MVSVAALNQTIIMVFVGIVIVIVICGVGYGLYELGQKLGLWE